MPSQSSADRIKQSLVLGENYEDFAFMVDVLDATGGPFTADLREYRERIICVIAPQKPKGYVSVMQKFRLEFTGIRENPELQLEFINTLRPAVFWLSPNQPVVWKPSLYFALPPRLEGKIDGWNTKY